MLTICARARGAALPGTRPRPALTRQLSVVAAQLRHRAPQHVPERGRPLLQREVQDLDSERKRSRSCTTCFDLPLNLLESLRVQLLKPSELDMAATTSEAKVRPRWPAVCRAAASVAAPRGVGGGVCARPRPPRSDWRRRRRPQVSLENELDVLRQLIAACDTLLKMYPTTAIQDQALINDEAAFRALSDRCAAKLEACRPRRCWQLSRDAVAASQGPDCADPRVRREAGAAPHGGAREPHVELAAGGGLASVIDRRES